MPKRGILKRVALVFFFAILVIYSSREVSDLDIWLHLETGQYIVQHRLIPHQDIFSFSILGKPWINHEWLFQVISYLFFSAGGFSGLIFMQAAVILLAFLALFFTQLRKNNPLVVFGVLYLTLLCCVYRIMIRPDIFSLLFISVYLCLLKVFAEKNSFWIWSLPVLQLAWANIHGFSFVGPLIVFIFILSELVKRYARLPGIDNQQIKKLLAIFSLLVLAPLANPYGLRGVVYPLNVLGEISGKGKIIFTYIMELKAPFSDGGVLDFNYLVFYKLLVIVSLLCFFLNRRRANIFDLFLWLVFLAFSLTARRNIVYFALVAGFVILNNTGAIFENARGLFLKFRRSAPYPWLKYSCIAVFFVYPALSAQKFITEVSANSLGTYELRRSRDGLAQARYPQKAVNFLLENNLPARMFNDFNSGSYLIGNAFPRRKVFIDGRTELYGADFFTEYVEAGKGDPDAIEKIMEKYAIQGFFLTISAHDLQDGLLDYLLHNPGWKPVYLDEAAIIFLKDVPENSELIGRFRIDLENWAPPPGESAYDYLYRMRFFSRHAFYQAAGQEAGNLLIFVPANEEARLILSDSYFYSGNAWKDKGDFFQAISFYGKALGINYRHLGARHNRAVAYFLTRQYDKSWDDILKLRELGADIHPEILKELKIVSGREK